MLLTKNPLPLVVGEVRVLFFRFIELRLDLKRKEIVKTKANKIHTFSIILCMDNGHAGHRNVMFNSTKPTQNELVLHLFSLILKID